MKTAWGWIAAACLACAGGAWAQVGAQPQRIGPAVESPRYDGHKWVRVTVTTLAQMRTVLALSEEDLSCGGHGVGTFDVRMTPEQFDDLRQTGIPHRVLFNDIQAAIEADWADNQARRANPIDFPGWYDAFKNYTELRAHFQDLANANPGLATLTTIGTSVEGRPLVALRITGPGSTAERPAILYTATQHAREWAVPMTVAYIAEHLITDYATDPLVKGLVDNIEFIIIPVVNPDGYEFTWQSAQNRMWRKNRRPAPPATPGCIGVDPNRNWGFQWGSNNGSSGDPCSETYRGATAFSEPETQAVRDHTIANPRIKASIDFHSYSQLIMSPWGYTSALPPDHAFFQQASQAMADAVVAVHGSSYIFGPGYTTIYPTSGSVKDWMYGGRGIFGWTIEVRDAGSYGFIMPPQEIIPNAEENYAAIKAQALLIGPRLNFSLPQGVPTHVVAGQANPVQVQVKPGVESMQQGTARLFYRFGTSGTPITVVMTNLGNGVYEGDLPSAPCGTTIQFVFQATTTTGAIVKYPTPGFSTPFETAARDIAVTFADSAETQTGWVVGGPGSNATGGVWVRNIPQFTLAQPGEDHTPAPGVFCYVTDHVAGTSVAQHDVDGGSTILTSPILNGTPPQPMDGAELWVTYWRWYSNDKGLNPNADSMLVQASNNAGAIWTTIEEINDNAGAWVRKDVRLSDFMAPTSQIRLRFIASDLAGDSVVEAAIDDVELRVVGCLAPVTCYPDCNESGGLTVADFGCFQGKYVLNELYADCNASGTLTVADFGCFQGKYVIGCP
ncbi:MAG: M14 family metallopeptidase [Phycisphaerales bacterium]